MKLMSKRAGKPFLELSGTSLRFGGRLLFRNTHWALCRGQHWALVGPNSSGKTLLARALAGEVPVVRGEIVYRFRLLDGRTPEEAVAHISFEQQKAVAGDDPPSMRWLTDTDADTVSVREFLSQDHVEEINPFEVLERPARSAAAFNRRVRQTLRLLQIDRLQHQSLRSLSNGEMRKTLLARALLRRPRLLILDDPFSGLDAQFRHHLKQILATLMKAGKVHLLLITGRCEDLPSGITHLMFVDRCRLVAQGRIRPMLADPRVRDLHLDGGSPRARPAPQHLSRALCPGKAEGEVLVSLEQATVRYGRHAILEGISWTIRRGENWALVGPNGSGKSTLLSLIIGDHPQVYANQVFLFGRRRGTGESVWQLKRRIGFISPELHLHFPAEQTCLQTVLSGFHDSHGLFGHPTRSQIRAAGSCLAAFGLFGVSGKLLGSLSAGLQRMTLLARALVKSPELLILDEPCQGLDFKHRMMFLRAVEGLLRKNLTTIIYVTHRRDEIPAGIRRIMRLRNTRMIGSNRLHSQCQKNALDV
jgi:molybdate transport system ATP-binding protein